jgi:hypothetical protein
MVKSPNGPISCPWPLQQPSAVPPPESSAAGTARHLQEAGSLGQQLQTAIDLWSPVKFKGKSSGHTTWIKIVHDCMIILHSIIIFYNYKVFFNIRNQKNLAISSLTRRPQVLRAVPSPWNAWIFQNRCEIRRKSIGNLCFPWESCRILQQNAGETPVVLTVLNTTSPGF